MASKTTAKPTQATAQTPPVTASAPMMDAEGNVNVVTDGTSYTLRPPLGEDMEKVENVIGSSGSRVRSMCAAIAVLSVDPLTVDEVLKWRFDKILEVSEGLKLFPSFAEME